MAKVPVYDSQERLQPTPIDPSAAATLGSEVADLGKGLSGIGQVIQKLDDKRQTLKAQTSLAHSHLGIQNMAATDPDLDTLDERVNQKSEEAVNQAADLIKSPEARQQFIATANLDVERRNSSVYNTILRRKSQDFKNELVQANDADVAEYQTMTDPGERQMIRQRILDRTNEAMKDGHINSEFGRAHAVTLLKNADINQVKSDMALNPTTTYEQLQKGKDGLYPYLNPKQQKTFMDDAQKQIAREGSDNKLIYSIAQNHTESTLIDKMANNQLTQADLNQAQTVGIKGIKARDQFAKAASDAINDPFPTESVPQKYNALINQIQDPSVDPLTLKLNVLNARGLTPQEKAHLINAHIREDEGDGKQSINQLITQGIKQNKTALMQAHKNLEQEISERQSLFRKITGRFRDHAKDEKHLASLQQDYMSKMQKVKDDQERLDLAQEIINHDTLKRNPGIKTADTKGTVFMDKKTGSVRKYYPSGFWEPVKGGND